MDLTNIKFTINKDGFLTHKENKMLLEKYYELFITMYGQDICDALLNVLKLAKISPKKPIYKTVISKSKNYAKATSALEQIMPQVNSEKLDLLMVYNNGKLISAARLRKINDVECSIPDAVFLIDDNITPLWREMIIYAENYFKELGFNKMYVEVPLHNPSLLKVCFDLDFREDEKDIVVSENTRTYLLNKKLERVRK